jgi:hypothetical protein
MYATLSRVSFWGIPFTQYHIPLPPCRQPPLKKGNSQMDSSVYRITRQLLHRVSTASFQSCRVHFHWNIRLRGQAKVVLGPTPLIRTHYVHIILCTATKIPFKCIPFLEISVPTCTFERFIYSQDRSIYFLQIDRGNI